MNLPLQNHTVTLPCVISPAHSLVFATMIGLDFTFFSGLHLSGNCYCFMYQKKHQCQPLREYVAWKIAGLMPQLAFFSAVARVGLVPLLPCNDLLQVTINTAHPDDLGKNQLSTAGKLRCLHSNTGMHGCSHAQNVPHT